MAQYAMKYKKCSKNMKGSMIFYVNENWLINLKYIVNGGTYFGRYDTEDKVD